MSYGSVYVPSGREVFALLTLVLLVGVMIGVLVSKDCGGLPYRIKIERTR